MTGTSLVRLGGRPDRSSSVAMLSQTMEATWSIALFEHLDAALTDPSSTMAGQEMISYSPNAWMISQKDFPLLLDEFRTRFDEFRAKWAQRFATEELHRVLLQAGWILQDGDGWYFSFKGTSQEIRNLYFTTSHMLVGDSEKLLVMMSSRVLHLQERLCKVWYKESAIDAISKILPSMEASFHEQEDQYIARLRASLAEIAFKRFSLAFKSRGKVRHFATSLACVRAVGSTWNRSGAYENAFLAFTDDFCDYACGLTLLVGEWYRDKWSLYLRGFSRGQLDLFGRSVSPLHTKPVE